MPQRMKGAPTFVATQRCSSSWCCVRSSSYSDAIPVLLVPYRGSPRKPCLLVLLIDRLLLRHAIAVNFRQTDSSPGDLDLFSSAGTRRVPRMNFYNVTRDVPRSVFFADATSVPLLPPPLPRPVCVRHTHAPPFAGERGTIFCAALQDVLASRQALQAPAPLRRQCGPV